MEQRTLNDLIEAKGEFRVEISYIKNGIDRIFNELKEINSRLIKMEFALQEKKGTSIRMRTAIFEFIAAYWHIIAIFASGFSFVLAYFFGIRVSV